MNQTAAELANFITLLIFIASVLGCILSLINSQFVAAPLYLLVALLGWTSRAY